MRVLVVDDSRTVRMALVAALRKAGGGDARVLEAGTAAEGLEAFRAEAPQLTFLDMVLDPATPGGEEGVATLRAMLDERPGARIVLVTALPATDPHVVQATGLGAFGRLGKPIKTDEVRALLQRVEAEEGRLGRIR